MAESLTTAIIGVGRWGKHIAHELSAQSNLVGYASRSNAHDAWASQTIPAARHMTLDEVCADKAIDAVAVATPIDTHATIARRLLNSGKGILVEKPAATSADEAVRLADEAAAHNLIFATGYVFLFHPVYTELKRRIENRSVRSVRCVWEKYGTFEEDIEMNLLSHHLALAYDLLGIPDSGTRKLGAGIESACDKVETRLKYEDGVMFTSSIDRTTQTRTHTITVETDNEILIWDGNTLSESRDNGATAIIYTANEEALACEIRKFLRAVQDRDASALPTAGLFGAHILSIHEQLAV